jgi:hypothetical protein
MLPTRSILEIEKYKYVKNQKDGEGYATLSQPEER